MILEGIVIPLDSNHYTRPISRREFDSAASILGQGAMILNNFGLYFNSFTQSKPKMLSNGLS